MEKSRVIYDGLVDLDYNNANVASLLNVMQIVIDNFNESRGTATQQFFADFGNDMNVLLDVGKSKVAMTEKYSNDIYKNYCTERETYNKHADEPTKRDFT